MKKIILLSMVIIASIKSFSQTKAAEPIVKSNFESFAATAGSFSKKEFYDIGKVGDITVQAVKLIGISNEKGGLNALRLTAVYSSNYTTDDKSAVLDLDEIDAYLKALHYISEKVISQAPPESDVEYNYFARGGFSSGVFNNAKKKKWTVYLDLEKYSSHSTFYLSIDDVATLIDLINKAKAKLI